MLYAFTLLLVLSLLLLLSCYITQSSDVWLADMNYRVAVRQQKEAWENIAAILERLFDRLRDIEINRKAAVKAILEETVSACT
jgi:uncharacterized protein YdaU (DUF1376 family)